MVMYRKTGVNKRAEIPPNPQKPPNRDGSSKMLWGLSLRRDSH